MIRPLTETEKAYIAGVMDGEGTIALSGKKPKMHHATTYSIHVCVTNTNMDLLSWLRQKTGFGKITPKPREGKWKLCYQWVLCVDEVVEFLDTVLPYMIVRAGHARLMVEFIGTTKNHGPSNPMTVDEEAVRAVIFDELASLNRRGV